MRRIGDAGLFLVQHYESLRLKAYYDSGGVLSIGYGHTGEDVYQGLVITEEEADDLLAMDLREAEDCVDFYVKVPLTQNQFDALVSLTFNIGNGNFKNSTLLKLLNREKYALAANQFKRWVYDMEASDLPLKGLVKRRREEAELFMEGM